MTFYEAAVEILRRSGRPLHFKKITENAVRHDLLSHVGKTPESTMESRLEQEMKKAEGSWIVMTRPGVYTLREDVAEKLNEEAQEREAKEAAAKEVRKPKPAPKARAEEPAAEAQSADDESDGSAEGSSDGGSRRRRRRRRRNGDSETRSDDSAQEAKSEEKRSEKSEKDDDDADASTDERESGRSRRGRGRRGRDRNKDRDTEKPKASAAAAHPDLDGSRYDSIAEASYAVLAANVRKTMTTSEIASVVFDKKLVRFHTHDPEATVQSAMVTDNQVRARRGRRPLFSQYRDGRWGLTEWGVSDEGIEKERQILRLADELRREAVAQLGEAVASLKAEAFEMVVMTLLERLDYHNMKVSKRTSEGDTFFTADWRRGFSDLRVCVQIVSDPDLQLEAKTIREIRETLNHYSAAEGIIIHLGDVSKEAVRESRDTESAKVTVIDRKAFVRLLVDEGIGVKSFSTPIAMVDNAFIDALQR